MPSRLRRDQLHCVGCVRPQLWRWFATPAPCRATASNRWQSMPSAPARARVQHNALPALVLCWCLFKLVFVLPFMWHGTQDAPPQRAGCANVRWPHMSRADAGGNMPRRQVPRRLCGGAVHHVVELLPFVWVWKQQPCAQCCGTGLIRGESVSHYTPGPHVRCSQMPPRLCDVAVADCGPVFHHVRLWAAHTRTLYTPRC